VDLAINTWDDVPRLASDPGVHAVMGRKEDVQQLLRFLRFQKGFNLPIEIRKSERPDFIITAMESNTTTGIEVTWAANPSWEEAEAYLGKTPIPKFTRISRNCVEGISKRGKALGRHLEARQLDSPIWHPREHAAAKAREVVNAIKNKVNSLSEASYQRFDQDWLIIADRSPFLFVEIDDFFHSLHDLTTWGVIQHDTLYFVTQLWNRTRREIEDVLCQFSRCRCQVIGRVPNTGELGS
jgi:hypothetical protein